MHPSLRLAAACVLAAAAFTLAASGGDAAGSPPIASSVSRRTISPSVAGQLGPSPEGWSVETGLGSAAARIEAATRIDAELDRQLIEQRLAEIAVERQAAAERLAALPPPTAPPRPATGHTAPNPGTWDRLAQCEAGGDWSINTGNGYSGGLQWHPGTWQTWRATGDPAQAWQATREQQIAAGERLVAASGGRFTAWPGCRRALGLP